MPLAEQMIGWHTLLKIKPVEKPRLIRVCRPSRSAIARELQKRSCSQWRVCPALRFGQPKRWLTKTGF
jgi:hypothetical protein